MSEEKQGNAPSSSEEKKPNNRNRNKNRNRNRNRNKKASTHQSSEGPSTNSRAKKKSKPRPKRRYKLSKEESIYNKYLTLMEHHLNARKKYYALFGRADQNQQAKLERNFTNSMIKVREFEEALDPADKEKFMERVNGYKLDLAYSQNHELDPEHKEVPHNKDEPEEPHYLETQKSTNFSSDTEESEGTLEDYLAYKGV